MLVCEVGPSVAPNADFVERYNFFMFVQDFVARYKFLNVSAKSLTICLSMQIDSSPTLDGSDCFCAKEIVNSLVLILNGR